MHGSQSSVTLLRVSLQIVKSLLFSNWFNLLSYLFHDGESFSMEQILISIPIFFFFSCFLGWGGDLQGGHFSRSSFSLTFP